MLALPERVTLEDAASVLARLAQALSGAADANGATATVDASALRRFDSAALAVLLECRRLAQTAGRGFAVHAAPAKLAALAKLYGLEAALPMTVAASPDAA